MAKTSSIQKNIMRQKLTQKCASKRKLLKSIIMDKTIDEKQRILATFKLAKMPKNSAKIRIRNRCELTGRPRGFYRKFKLSRLALRNLALQGMIPGLSKASW